MEYHHEPPGSGGIASSFVPDQKESTSIKLFLLLVSLVTTPSLTVNGQTARFEKGDLVVSDGAKQIRIAELSDPPGFTPRKPCVHSLKKIGDDYYVLVTTSAYTRGYPPKGGFGGGGEEHYLIWLHIADSQPVERVEHRYQSFVYNRDGRIEGWNGSIFTVKAEGDVEEPPDNKNTRQDITFTFDAKHPEAGIKQTRGPPKPDQRFSHPREMQDRVFVALTRWLSHSPTSF